MRTVTRYLGREIYRATAFVFLAFLALFVFFDLINELDDVGKGRYRLAHAFLFVLLSVPGHVYELFPIAVLIGTLAALSTLAANSEYTVMRVSGLSPLEAVGTLVRIGSVFVALSIAFGELVGPEAERAAQRLRLDRLGAAVGSELRTGLWVKSDTQFVNIGEVSPDTTLKGVRIYDFDREFRLLSISQATSGRYEGGNTWRLASVVQTRFGADGATVRELPTLDWVSVVTPEMLNVLLVVPEKLSAWGLYQYTRHLTANKQRSDRYEIALWKKLIYPFAGPGDDGARAALRLHAGAHRWGRGEALLRAHARRPLSLPEQPVLAHRGARALAAARRGRGAERDLPRRRDRADVVGGAAMSPALAGSQNTVRVPASRSWRNWRSRSTRHQRMVTRPGVAAIQATAARGSRHSTTAATAVDPSALAASA